MRLAKFPDRKWIAPVQAALIYGWLVNLQGTDAYYSVYILVAVGAVMALLRNGRERTAVSGSGRISCGILGGCFSGAVALANYALFTPWPAMMTLANVMVTLLGGWVAFDQILLYGMTRFPLGMNPRDRSCPKKVFLAGFLVIAGYYLVNLFFLLYPGLLTADSFTAVRQVLEGSYDNRMPYWHTRTMGLFLKTGLMLFGDINAALALFMSVQILFMAACFSLCVTTLYQAGIPRGLCLLTLLGYTLLPYHVYYGSTLWKDVLFSGAALLLITGLYRILTGIGKSKLLNELVCGAGAVGLCLWRTNGWAAMVAVGVIFFLALRKEHRRLVGILAGVIVVCGILTGPLLSAWNVPGTDFVEGLGIPFQQVARVVASDCPIGEEQTQMLSQVFDLEAVRQNYDPKTVDPIKFSSMQPEGKAALRENPVGYIGLWLKLGCQYPQQYLQAWIEATKGYWNAGYDYWIHIYASGTNELGIVNSGGGTAVAALLKMMERVLEKTAVLQPLYSIGLHIWMLIGCGFWCVFQRRKEWLLTVPLGVLVLGLWVGTPVFAEFRYAYPVFTALPVILAATMFRKEKSGDLPSS